MRCGLLGESFPELSALDQTDDGIADEVALRGGPEGREKVIVLAKKREIL